MEQGEEYLLLSLFLRPGLHKGTLRDGHDDLSDVLCLKTGSGQLAS